MRMPDELTLAHVPPLIQSSARTVGLVVIGSHIWGMNHENSDLDSMAIVQEDTTKILRREGKWQTQSYFRSETDHGYPVDIHVHEIGRTMDFLLKSNINFLVGVLSPIVVHESFGFSDLRKVVEENPAKNVYDSIHGMAVQNMARYAGIKRGTFYTAILEELHYTPIDERRCGKMLAYLEFGINYLDTGKASFQKPNQYTWNTQGVVEAIKDLDIAYVDSKLPAKPDEKALHEWLLNQRLSALSQEQGFI